MESYIHLKRRTIFEGDTHLHNIGIDYETSQLWLTNLITL
jgi:hypothetical protein